MSTKIHARTTELDEQLDLLLISERALSRTAPIGPRYVLSSDPSLLEELSLARRALQYDYRPASAGKGMLLNASVLLKESGAPEKVVAAISKTPQKDALDVYIAFMYSEEKYEVFKEITENEFEEKALELSVPRNEALRAVVVGPFTFEHMPESEPQSYTVEQLSMGIVAAARDGMSVEANVLLVSQNQSI